MDKLYLLDAYALIFRAYYAFIKNPRINSRGENTSAILGFVNTLEEVLTKGQPTHVGVAFDPPTATFRHEAFPAYKAQREETPEAIRYAVPYIKSILENWERGGYKKDNRKNNNAGYNSADCRISGSASSDYFVEFPI